MSDLIDARNQVHNFSHNKARENVIKNKKKEGQDKDRHCYN